MVKIDLSSFAGGMLIAGRDKGTAARLRFELDRLDTIDEDVVVTIPSSVISLNSSFFLGMFGKSIKNMGRNEFLKKYKFVCAEVVQEDIASGIRQALNTSNPLVPA